jgi:hypothetical protein
MQLLQQKDLTEGVLYRLIGCRCTRCDAHDNFLVQVGQEWFRHNLSRHGSVCNGIVGTDALGAINVEGTNARKVGNLEQVRRVGRIKSTNDQDKVQTQLLSLVRQFADSVLSLLCRNAKEIVTLGMDTT